MKLDHPFLQLPVCFDAERLAREIEALGSEAWRPHPQGYPGNDALPLVSVGGDAASDAVHGPMRPTPELLACPYLMQVMHSLGAVWGRSRLMRLAGQAEVTPHVDINYYWREHMRIHVPIVTQPTVRFVCDGRELNMAEGECWTFDTWRLHHVHNDDSRARIHLVADTVGGPGFWAHMRDARPHDEVRAGWQPRMVAPRPTPVALQFESVNLPAVMSPWEVRAHAEFLAGEAADPELSEPFMRHVVAPFLREWQALWALHGDQGGGMDDYRAARGRLLAQVPPFKSIRLRNEVPLVHAFNAIVVANLVAEQPAMPAPAPQPVQGIAIGAGTTWSANWASPRARNAAAPRPSHAATAGSAVGFDRPLILLSAPRSGSTLLFETLSQAPGVFTVGHESHRQIESLPGLHPAHRGFESNRLTASDASPEIVAGLKRNLAMGLRDRHGRPPAPGASVRLLEKTPKNTLRVGFLRAAFPDARFVYLYREPRPVLASMIEAWESGRFTTYRDLPGWSGLPWSLLLVPGWKQLAGRPLEEIVAQQWATTTRLLLDDLEALPAGACSSIRYEAFLARPDAESRRLCEFAGLGWDLELRDLPLSRHTISAPDPDKWRRHEAAISRVWPIVADAAARAERFVGNTGGGA